MSQIINDTDEVELFDRNGRKKRKHLTFSAELLGVLEHTQGDGGASKFLERAAWRLLVDEYGVEEVRAAIREVQDEIEADDRLVESKTYTIEV